MNNETPAEIDLIKIVQIVWKKKISVSLITLFFILVFIGVSYLIAPVFQAKAVLASITSDMSGSDMTKNLGGLASIVGIGGPAEADESIVNMATFESRKFMREFIQENKLIPILFESEWDSTKQSWKDEEPTMWDSVNYFDEEIRSIIVDQENGLVTLSINWTDPELSVKWADLMVLKINKVLHEEFLRETNENLIYLNEQLEETQNGEMRSVLYSLIQEQVKKEMLSKSDLNFAYKVVDPAVVPQDKTSPKRSLFALMGMLLGGIISVIYVYVWDMRNNKVNRKI